MRTGTWDEQSIYNIPMMRYQWCGRLISGVGTFPFKPYLPICTHTPGIQEKGDLVFWLCWKILGFSTFAPKNSYSFYVCFVLFPFSYLTLHAHMCAHSLGLIRDFASPNFANITSWMQFYGFFGFQPLCKFPT